MLTTLHSPLPQWALYLSTPLRWERLPIKGTGPPAGLYGHSAAATFDGSSLIVFGGFATSTAALSANTFEFSTIGFTGPNALAAQMVNIALGRPTEASSQANTPTVLGGNPTDAEAIFSGAVVDGNTAQAFGTGVGTCFVSYFNASLGITGTANPWWRVDLGSAQAVYQLRVWMRNDALTTSNNGVSFWVSNSTTTPTSAGSGAVLFPNPFQDPIYNPNSE